MSLIDKVFDGLLNVIRLTDKLEGVTKKQSSLGAEIEDLGDRLNELEYDSRDNKKLEARVDAFGAKLEDLNSRVVRIETALEFIMSMRGAAKPISLPDN